MWHCTAVYRESYDMDATVGNKKMVGICTSDHAQLEYNNHKLLHNLLAASLFPISLDLPLVSKYTALATVSV